MHNLSSLYSAYVQFISEHRPVNLDFPAESVLISLCHGLIG